MNPPLRTMGEASQCHQDKGHRWARAGVGGAAEAVAECPDVIVGRHLGEAAAEIESTEADHLHTGRDPLQGVVILVTSANANVTNLDIPTSRRNSVL
jgi:hypothetical protein